MSDSVEPKGEHPVDPKNPQAGDSLEHPASLSDPPKPEPEPDTNLTTDAAAIGPIPVLGYDVLEPREEAVILCARIAHAVVEAMNGAMNETTLPWEVSGPSCLAGVKRVLANPRESAEENHNAWMAYKAAEGWVYGSHKDPVAKTHPCMLPYKALGPFQQSKDAVFHAVVKTMFGV